MKGINTSIFGFPTLRDSSRDYIYVDKTAQSYEIAKPTADRIYYLLRPRRFGKSLMISTQKALFEGRRELFKGLAVFGLALGAALACLSARATDGSFIQGLIDAAPDGGTVSLAAGTYTLSAPLLITGKVITLKSESGDPADVTLDGESATALLNAKTASTISGITFVHGNWQRDDDYAMRIFGGPVALLGATLTNCVVRDCTVRIDDETLAQYEGGHAGGVIAQGEGALVVDCLIKNCAYVKNVESFWRVLGGGMAVLKGAKAVRCHVTGCTVQNRYNNTSPNGLQGGGIYVAGGTVEDSVVCSNRLVQLHASSSYDLAGAGGGVSLDGADSLLVNTLVISNRAYRNGGGVYVGSATMRGCTIADNVADADAVGASGKEIYGAGALVSSGLVEDCLIFGNSSASCASSCGGGGLQLGEGGRVYGSVVSNNTCAGAAGVKFSPGCKDMVVSNCWITANKATSNGGAFSVYGRATLLVADSVVSDNDSSNGSFSYWYCWNGVWCSCVFRNTYFKGKSGQDGFYFLPFSNGIHPMVFENCTFTGSKEVFKLAYGTSPFPTNLFVRSCVFAGNTTDIPDLSDTTNVCYSYIHSASAAKLPSGAQYGNHTAEDVADPKFRNAAAGDWRFQKDSPLLDEGGPAESWMGTGRPRGPLDAGDGTFSSRPAATITVLGKSYDVGVKLTRNAARRRLYNGKPDPGCFEYNPKPGLAIIAR